MDFKAHPHDRLNLLPLLLGLLLGFLRRNRVFCKQLRLFLCILRLFFMSWLLEYMIALL